MTPLTPLLGSVVPVPRFPDHETVAIAKLCTQIDTLEKLAAGNDLLGRYPTESVAILRETAILGLGVPLEFGGIGSGHRASLEAQVRLGMADSAVAQVFKVHDELVREIFVYGPPGLRGPLAARILDEGHIIGLAVAETGKKVDDPWTSVVLPTADGFEINGTKIYTTGAAEADEVAVWAFNPTVPGIDTNPLLGFQLSLVPRGSHGMTVHRDWDALGQRATDSGTITFDHVEVAADARASEPGRAPVPQNAVRYQAGFAAVLVGIGLGAVAAAAPFVRDRARPWPSAGVDAAADDPMVRRLCGELVTDLTAAYHATMATGDLLDAFERGEVSRTELAVPIYAAKAAASRAAVRATSEIYALLGTRGVARVNGFDRYWRNARTLSLHDPVDWKHEEVGHHVLTGWDPPPGIYQ